MKTLAIIPARAGSKGVPKKNIREIAGKPLLAYAIETAKASKLITKTIVSTESDEVIEVAKTYGCEVLKRTEKNAQDHSLIDDVIKEILEKLNEDFDIIMLLQPTAPIREAEDVDKVIKMFIQDKNTECVVSVVPLGDIHPAHMYTLDNAQNMESLEEDGERKRRQDLNPFYIRNGCIYAIKQNIFKKNGKIIHDKKKAYVMPELRWANIDTERDFLMIEVLIKQWKKGLL